MEDLSGIYEQFGSDRITALSPTSMAGGNMMSSNHLAMTSPGSPPVDPLPPAKNQGDPKITPSGGVPVGTPAKRKPSAGPSPSPVTWKVMS